MTWAAWQGCSQCASGPAPGARALLAWLLEAYPAGESMGIYNCRPVRGASSLSIHACGRAVDFDPDGARGRSGFTVGRQLVARLGEHGAPLGIQSVIYNRTIWSAASPRGRDYGGVHPHNDHLHIELNRTAAQRLNLATLRSTLGGASHEEDDVLKRGDSGDEVRYVQEQVNRVLTGRHDSGPLTVDGQYGPATEREVKNAQEALGWAPTGQVHATFADRMLHRVLYSDIQRVEIPATPTRIRPAEARR